MSDLSAFQVLELQACASTLGLWSASGQSQGATCYTSSLPSELYPQAMGMLCFEVFLRK